MRRIRVTAIAGTAVALVAGARRFTRYEIADRSMEPTLCDGDWVLAVLGPGRLRRGDVVVVEHPGRPGFEMVKRVAALGGDPEPGGDAYIPPDALWLLGDHPAAGSVDSRALGPVPRDAVRAKILLRYRPLPMRLIGSGPPPARPAQAPANR